MCEAVDSKAPQSKANAQRSNTEHACVKASLSHPCLVVLLLSKDLSIA